MFKSVPTLIRSREDAMSRRDDTDALRMLHKVVWKQRDVLGGIVLNGAPPIHQDLAQAITEILAALVRCGRPV